MSHEFLLELVESVISSGQGATWQLTNWVVLPTQSEPLNFGAGFVQDRFIIKNPVPQIDCEQLVTGTESVQLPLTIIFLQIKITFFLNHA